MLLIFKSLSVFPISIILISFSTFAQAAPNDLKDLVGSRASSGESVLQSKGYKFIKSEKGDDRIWSYWYQASTNNCITVATVNGRYDAITESPMDCRESPKIHNKQVNIENPLSQPKPSNKLEKISSLIGARASGAENILIENGYKSGKGYTGAKTKSVMWWNPLRQECIAVITANGRIKQINQLDQKSCN
ncbi:hypothetical protein [Acinetobacter modestus]|uniref:hypothetical protein n=1 Tax=Acinetobacter modestus TaxID=1776740 RepID=UPI001F4A2972|nr:hypothetical protein [Acinetobacter modestus]MCH7330628.1 hypothetical protein [Acinetobacter modestus]